jgi:outer membrane protein
MKKIKKSISLILIIFVFGFSNAQTKVAHINSQELISLMPEMKLAKAEFSKFQKSLEDNIQNLITDYNNKLTQYSDEALSKTEIENENREKELNDLIKHIEETRINSEKIAEQKYLDLTEPIRKKALSTIQKVGKEKGFSFVLDSTNDSVFLLKDGVLTDLMKAVKEELNIEN